jgi:acyl dehydratase
MTLTEGTQLEPVEVTATLQTSVAYAAASGDLNPLHYDQEFAAGVSPTGGIIAHGMYSMGLASRALTVAAGGPDAVESIEVRFTKPWPLGATASFGGEVREVADGVATVRLRGQLEDGTVILRGRGVVRV